MKKRTLKKEKGGGSMATPSQGGGLGKTIVNFLSGRKTIKKKYTKPISLAGKNQERKTELQNKWFKTQKEKKELRELSAKVGPTAKQEQQALRRRLKIQKYFNRYYPKKSEELPTSTSIEGVMTITRNTRNPLSKEKLQTPNSNLPEASNIVEQRGYRVVNGNPISLAGQATVLYINAPLYYAQWRQEAPRARLEDITDEEFAEFLDALKDPNDVRTIFHIPENISEDDWFLNMEEGLGFEQGVYNIVDFNYTFIDGTRIEKTLIKVPSSVTIPRLFGDLGSGKKTILKNMEIDICTCASTLDTNDTPQHYTPLTTLKSNGCIQIYRNEEEYEMALDWTGTIQGKGWMIIPPPINTKSIPITAKYLRSLRIFQEALDGWAFNGIDSALLELFQAKYPELYCRVSTYILNTYDFPYQFTKFKPTDNYLLLDKSVYARTVSFTALNPFTNESSIFNPIVRKAAFQRKLFGMSPYMAYMMKKLDMILWKKAFQSEENTKNTEIYKTLNPYEKITIDYLQHLRFRNTLVDSNYNFAEARDTYMDFLGVQSVEAEILESYSEEIEANSEQCVFFQTLVKYQMPPEEQENFLQREQDIQRLLKKFQPLQSRLPLASMPRFPPVSKQLEETQEVQELQKSYQRIRELERGLEQNREKYEGLVDILGGEQYLKERLNYFAKLKQKERNTKRLGRIIRNEQQTRKNYEFVRNYPMKAAQARAELARRKNKIEQSGYYPLPSTNA